MIKFKDLIPDLEFKNIFVHLFALIVAFAFAAIAGGLLVKPSHAQSTVTPTLIATQPAVYEGYPVELSPVVQGYPAEATPLPEELIANREQTFGITLGSVILVLIVIIGTLIGIRWRKKSSEP